MSVRKLVKRIRVNEFEFLDARSVLRASAGSSCRAGAEASCARRAGAETSAAPSRVRRVPRQRGSVACPASTLRAACPASTSRVRRGSAGVVLAWAPLLPHVPAPESEQELFDRACDLAGRTLGELAARFGVPIPADTLHGKGFAGSLLERCLGATAKSRARPDFEVLGVELKTLPVDARGRPLESTFVCTIPLVDVAQVEWEGSIVRHKLARVLWIPILSERHIALTDRTVGAPLLWSPSADEEADLRWDFEELTGLIARGRAEDVTGHLGRFLQVRPKAANSRARRAGFDEDGVPAQVLPRGFYLRPQFTARLFAERLAPRVD